MSSTLPIDETTGFQVWPAELRMRQAVVLFAHGARDPDWARPMWAICERCRLSMPEVEVRLAFLEFMTPTLAQAVAELCGQGARAIRIVPLFLAQGGHLKRDLPSLIEALRLDHPGTELTLDRAIGESLLVQDAIAAQICHAVAGSHADATVSCAEQHDSDHAPS
ncbi:MAG: hypothetical protein IOMNBAOH_00609 [Rhodocyclaceae bacterium]|nr:hypothetical protein [Rhodocyclaceae bacterium]